MSPAWPLLSQQRSPATMLSYLSGVPCPHTTHLSQGSGNFFQKELGTIYLRLCGTHWASVMCSWFLWQASSAHRLYTDRLPPPASLSWTQPRTSHCGTNPPTDISPSLAQKPSLVSQGPGGCCLQTYFYLESDVLGVLKSIMLPNCLDKYQGLQVPSTG